MSDETKKPRWTDLIGIEITFTHPAAGEDAGQFLARMFELSKRAPITYGVPEVDNPLEAAQIAARYSALTNRLKARRHVTKRGVLITLGTVALWAFAIGAQAVYIRWLKS